MKRLFASLALSAAVLAPGVSHAQSLERSAQFVPSTVSAPLATTTTSAAAASSNALVRPDVAGIRTSTDANAPFKVNAAASEGLHQGEGVALMSVGGAGLVAGLLIGGNAGTAVAIGGLAVGLIGLYEYVK